MGTRRPRPAEWPGAGRRFSSQRGVCSALLPTATFPPRRGCEAGARACCPPGTLGEGRSPGHILPAPLEVGEESGSSLSRRGWGGGWLKPRRAGRDPPWLRAFSRVCGYAVPFQPPAPGTRMDVWGPGHHHGIAQNSLCARRADRGLLSPWPRAYASPGPPQAQPRPGALGAVARRRLRCRDAAGRAGETSGEKEQRWPGLRAASGRVRGPNSSGAEAARGRSIRARADAVRGAANSALVHQGAGQAAAGLLPAPQKLANAG